MRKIFYIAITFIICHILKLEHIWIGFVPAFLLMSLFRIDGSFLWEIPLAALFCNVLEIAFAEDVKMLIYVLTMLSTLLVSVWLPKRLFVLFPIAIFAVMQENIYAIASLWAATWFGIRMILHYFTTKQLNLQEHKL